VAASEGHNRWRQVVVHRRLATLRRVELQRRIVEGTGKFLLFALTPPRLTTEPEHARQIAAKTLERLRPVGIDGLVLYDIDDESDRNPEERPFPFLPTMDPADVPRWIENELRHAEDTLEASYDQAVATAVELIAFCRRVGIPFGVSVESVSIRQVEIDASVRLATRLQAELRR
jgi:hypothetical protein